MANPSRFSASDAALEGLNLVGRRWRVVLGWAVFNLLALIMVVVTAAVLSTIATALAGGSNVANSPAEMAAGVFGLVCALQAQAVIATGVFRLELRPDQPAFLHLRLGGDEFRLLLIWLICITGAWAVLWAGMVAGAVSGPGRWAIEALAAVLLVYLLLRFALVSPSSFTHRRIDFPQAWRLSRGRVLALLGMTALSLSLIGLVMVAVLVALVAVAFVIGGFSGLAGVFGGSEGLQAHPAVFLLAFAVEIILTPVLWMLAMAPLAAAYRAFTEGEAAA